MWVVTMRSIGGEPQEYPIRAYRTTLGRRSDNDIVIADASASRYHAEILYEAEQDELYLRDLGSTNGTYVNRIRREDKYRLSHNDVIRIGECTLHVRRQSTQENPALAPPGMQVLTRDVMLESIDQHAVLMYEVARKLNTVFELDTALQEVATMIKRSLGADRCEVILKERFGVLHELGFPASIARQAIDMRATVNIADIDQEPGQPSASAFLFHIRSVLCVPILAGEEVMGLIYLYKIDPVDRPFDERDVQLAVAISHQAALTIQRMQLLKRVQEEQRIRQLLERFVSPSEAEYIFQNYQVAGTLPGLAEHRVTVLFADIADSTGMAEQLGPKRFGQVLSRYYQETGEIVFQNGGMVDKYLGDGIMAVFGMTGDHSEHEVRAVRAGLEILEAIERMNSELSEPITIGVGVNTGTVVAGYVGTDQRVELTVLGDTVNVASGLQSNARPNRLLIGPATMAGIVGVFPTQRVGSIRVKGRERTIQAHEVIRHGLRMDNSESVDR